MAADDIGKLLRVGEVAELLCVRVCTIRSWILHRRIPFVRVGRRSIRIPFSVVQRIVQMGYIPAREDEEPLVTCSAPKAHE
jgi:excisionase family DNA binding protein